MSDSSQTLLNNLILAIEEAEERASVTNEMVAEALDLLLNVLKEHIRTLATGHAEDVAALQADIDNKALDAVLCTSNALNASVTVRNKESAVFCTLPLASALSAGILSAADYRLLNDTAGTLNVVMAERNIALPYQGSASGTVANQPVPADHDIVYVEQHHAFFARSGTTLYRNFRESGIYNDADNRARRDKLFYNVASSRLMAAGDDGTLHRLATSADIDTLNRAKLDKASVVCLTEAEFEAREAAGSLDRDVTYNIYEDD